MKPTRAREAWTSFPRAQRRHDLWQQAFSQKAHLLVAGLPTTGPVVAPAVPRTLIATYLSAIREASGCAN